MTTLKETIQAWLSEVELAVEKLDNDDFEIDLDSTEELFKHMHDMTKDLLYLYGLQEFEKRG